MPARLSSFLLLTTLWTYVSTAAYAATDTTHHLPEVTISGFQENDTRFTSLNIEPYSLQKIDERTPYNLSDGLAKIPGIWQMTTGNAISKPVIRGLYGNRILILLSGNRFGNQQWQDEHGLGLSQIGIDRVEVIRGPVSLLYGSEAMGGAVNIIEEVPRDSGLTGDAGTRLYSNTMGTLTDAGIAWRRGNTWLRARAGAETHTDYSDGNDTRVLNSRNSGYYGKLGMGWRRGRWTQENSYNFSYNQFGFILDGLNTFFSADERRSRAYGGPHHNVLLNVFNSQNTIRLPHSTLQVNAGMQSNIRKEDEGGGQISLDIRQLSALESARWQKSLSKHTTAVISQQLTAEWNRNYGPRILIPDANTVENNLSGYISTRPGRWVVELGAGANNKSITTFRTKALNSPGEAVQPFAQNRTTATGMLGLAYNANEWLILKTNTATGLRAPNLAELSANGLHEGFYRYEIGDPNLLTELNLNTDFTIEANHEWVFATLSAYYNTFHDYVYLAPTTENYFSFPVYRYRQQNATLAGGEAALTLSPPQARQWSLTGSYARVQGTLANGQPMPFIPAGKFTGTLRWEKSFQHRISNAFVSPEYVFSSPQNHPGQFETATPAYYLVNFNAGITISAPSGRWVLGVSGINLTNAAYYDHLSRLKYYNLLNTGRNISFSVRKFFH
ncbi:MAG: TonB-dependent receptor [Taibaiella sp.]|nr:TonB-dependent receptor [Taibaiella sp.]